MAFIGVALALGLQRRSLDGLNYTGLGLAFLSSVGITTVILTTTATTAALSAVRANLHMNVSGLIYFAALALVLPALGLAGETVYPQTAAAWLYVLLAALGFTLGYLLFFFAAKILGATEASVLSILELVFMIFFAVTLVGERLTALQTTGFLIVVVALVGFELVSARKG
jgi:drug/metabolite transporter (DMT)-like permease